MLDAGTQHEHCQAVAMPDATVQLGTVCGHSTPNAADSHLQLDLISSPLTQRESPLGSTADFGSCCPSGAPDCPAMHIQFLPDPATTAAAAVAPATAATAAAAAKLPDMTATELWLEAQLSSIAASNSPAAEPHPCVASQPSSVPACEAVVPACEAVTPSAEVLRPLPAVQCPQEPVPAMGNATTGLQPVAQPQMSPITALPSAQVALQTPAAQLPQTATCPAFSADVHTHNDSCQVMTVTECM